MSPIIRIFKEPFFQFLLLGAVVFFLFTRTEEAERAALDQQIILDAPTLTWIYGNFTKQFRRPPTRSEMDALIAGHIEGEVKYRHALDMGLDDRDSIIQRRMMQKFDFLFGNGAADAMPDDETLATWYAEHGEEFTEPARISFAHVYFSPDRRAHPRGDAEAALKILLEGGEAEGDLFPFEVRFDEATPWEVRAVLGEDFRVAVFDGPIGEWHGPVTSGLGEHLVFISEITPEVLPEMPEVREAVLQRWREVESDRILETLIEELTAQFEVELDEAALETFEYGIDDAGIIQ